MCVVFVFFCNLQPHFQASLKRFLLLSYEKRLAFLHSFTASMKSLLTLERLAETMGRNGAPAALDMGIDILLKRRIWVHEIKRKGKQLGEYPRPSVPNAEPFSTEECKAAC